MWKKNSDIQLQTFNFYQYLNNDFEMSFQQKLISMKTKLNQSANKTQGKHQHHTCPQQIIVTQPQQQQTVRDQLCFQQPIIIQKKTSSRPASAKKQNKTDNIPVKVKKVTKKQVQPFVPIQLPVRQKKVDFESITIPATDGGCVNKEIQIKIEKDDKKDKECLKKLFKKIHKLTDDFNESEKQNARLKFQLQNLKNVSRTCNQHERIISRLDGEKYKLQVELDLLKRLLKERDDELKKVNSRTPKEIIKQVVIEKPVEVIVQVPKHIPGPQKTVQKIVQIPKYIEVQKKVPVQVNQPAREIIKTVQVPTIVQKPIYIDKPIYLDRPVEVERRVEVPVEVPVQVPVYVDKPLVEEEWITRMRHLEGQMQILIKQNDSLCHENCDLKRRLEHLTANLQVLSRHNLQKNRQTEILMRNNFDYFPISPAQDISAGSVGYSISTHPHTRII